MKPHVLIHNFQFFFPSPVTMVFQILEALSTLYLREVSLSPSQITFIWLTPSHPVINSIVTLSEKSPLIFQTIFRSPAIRSTFQSLLTYLSLQLYHFTKIFNINIIILGSSVFFHQKTRFMKRGSIWLWFLVLYPRVIQLIFRKCLLNEFMNED